MSRNRVLLAVAAVLAVAGLLVLTGVVPPLTAEGRKAWYLERALDDLAETTPGFAVAVLDKAGEREFTYRGSDRFDTASAVKVAVLACVLLHAQDQNRSLTGTERGHAERMIKASDNDATTALFTSVGSAAGLTKCDERLGMQDTEVDGEWGTTTTTAEDQLRLLGNLADDESELSLERRKYVFTLMSQVNADQVWGVPSAARDGEEALVKNGWDTRADDGGRWVVNTLGRLVSTDRSTDVTVVVLSHGSATKEDGVALVEKVVAATREHLGY
ncbi:MAG TPA: serine hydrolase [Actinoplanes sp.]|nr:serine hydrolase [Actinoplanes sp.]